MSRTPIHPAVAAAIKESKLYKPVDGEVVTEDQEQEGFRLHTKLHPSVQHTLTEGAAAIQRKKPVSEDEAAVAAKVETDKAEAVAAAKKKVEEAQAEEGAVGANVFAAAKEAEAALVAETHDDNGKKGKHKDYSGDKPHKDCPDDDDDDDNGKKKKKDDKKDKKDDKYPDFLKKKGDKDKDKNGDDDKDGDKKKDKKDD